MSSLPALKFINPGKLFRFQLRKKTLLTYGLVTIGAAALITVGSIILAQRTELRRGRGKVYRSPTGLRMTVTYDHLPDIAYDVKNIDASLEEGSSVIVWAFSTRPWDVQATGERGNESVRGGYVSPAGVWYILMGVFLLLWYYLGVRK